MTLLGFVRECDSDPDLQEKISRCQTPEEIIEIAKSKGFNISFKELRDAAPDLSASYWVWSEKGMRFRAKFFSRKRPLTELN